MATQLNLADLIASTQNSNAGTQEAVGALAQASAESLMKISQRATDTAELQRLVTSTAGLAEAKAQQNTLEAATLLGTNPEATNYILADYITQKNERFQEARALQQEIARKRSTTLANPLEWLEAQLTVNNDINAYNAAAADYNLVGRQIDDLVAMTGDIDKMNNLIAVTKTNESVRAESEIAAAKFLDLADKAKVEALQLNSEGILRVQSLKQNQLDNAFRERSQQMEEARFALAQRNAAMEQTRLSLALAKAKRDEKDEQISLASWNAFRASAGLPPATQQMFEMSYRADADGTMKEVNNGLKTLYSKQADPQGDARFLGSTPAEALTVVSKYNLNFTDGRQKLIGMVGDTLNKLPPDQQKGSVAQVSQNLNKAVSIAAQAQHKAVTSSENIYSPPSLQVLMGDPAIASTQSGQLVLKSLADSGQKAFDPKIVIPQILEQVKQKKIPLATALADIDFIAQKSIMYNNNYYSYKNTLGIPDQTALNIQLDTTGLFAGMVNQATSLVPNSPFSGPVRAVLGGQKFSVINLADRAQVQDYANKYLSASILPELRSKAAAQNNR